jgi:ribosomal protein S18 acetylase RimI-like enzyme
VPTDPTVTIYARPGLSPSERDRVEVLRACCNAHEGLDLKLDLAALDPADGHLRAPSQFLAYVGEQLVGYCSLDQGGDIEVCGMVHPAQRQRGVGHRLLDVARHECRRRGASYVLLICEDASASGRAFVSALGLARTFAEHRMECDVSALAAAPSEQSLDGRLSISRAGPADLDAVAAVQAAAFGDGVGEVRQLIAQDLREPNVHYYVAHLGEFPVGSLKVYTIPPRAGIYAFGVAPAYRRRGIGRQILLQVIARLGAEGYVHIWLEVDTDNVPAQALYRSAGLRVTTTYGYYRLDL